MQQTNRAMYTDATQSAEDRADDLLSRMTLDEKIAQLGSAWVYEVLDGTTFSETKARTLFSHGIGQITRLGGASSVDPVSSAKLANTIQSHLVKQTRLGIPAMVHEECCSGYMARGATCFPQIIGVASTWEPELVEQLAGVIRQQMRAVGAHQGLAPVLDVVRDPRWGRCEETFGEDPYLISVMGSAYIRGLQGQDLTQGIVATGKHFVGYGMSEGGMNFAPAHLGTRELHEVFLYPFEAAVKTANLGSMMNAYHELDGIPCGSSRELLTEILRDQWGFEGIVVSDYFAVDMLSYFHHIAKDKQEAAKLGLEAAIDVELPSTDCYGDPLRKAIKDGQISEALVDTCVRRMLRMKFLLGLFENPYVDAGAVVFDTPEQRTLAHEIAQKSIILLKNENEFLPLKKDLSSIAVIGPNADSVRNLLGDYAYPAHIETLLQHMKEKDDMFRTALPDKLELAQDSVSMISVLEAIKRKVSAQTNVYYANGCDVMGESRDGFGEAVEAASKADVAVLVVGDKSGLTKDCTCGESRDRATLGLPGIQDELVRAVYETGTPIVIVLTTGRPLTIPWMAEHIPAILEAWLPGEEGANAIADVLFGDFNPGGKLPMSFPKDIGQIPTFYNHKPSGGRTNWNGDYVDMTTKPLFPFGHGLSYTTFEFSNLRIDGASGDSVTVGVDVTNVGKRSGDEVVQLYLHDPVASVTRPVKELKGILRLTFQPGEKRTVTFQFSVNQMAFYNRTMDYVVEPGTIEVMVGSSSNDIRLTGTFEIAGQTRSVDKVFYTTTSTR
jgi:beta-glucosidase